MKRINYAQSIMVEGLDKYFVLGGEATEENRMANGMFIYDFKEQTWEHKDTPWDI